MSDRQRFVARVAWTCGAALLAIGAGGVAWGVGQWRQQRALADAIRLVGDGAYSAAVPALVAATTAAPDDARAHYYLSRAYFCLGAHGGALGQLREIVPAPARADADATARAALLLDRGQPDEAVAALRQEIARHPDALDARLFLVQTLATEGDGAGVREQYRELARRARGSALAPVLTDTTPTISPPCR